MQYQASQAVPQKSFVLSTFVLDQVTNGRTPYNTVNNNFVIKLKNKIIAWSERNGNYIGLLWEGTFSSFKNTLEAIRKLYSKKLNSSEWWQVALIIFLLIFVQSQFQKTFFTVTLEKITCNLVLIPSSWVCHELSWGPIACVWIVVQSRTQYSKETLTDL